MRRATRRACRGSPTLAWRRGWRAGGCGGATGGSAVGGALTSAPGRGRGGSGRGPPRPAPAREPTVHPGAADPIRPQRRGRAGGGLHDVRRRPSPARSGRPRVRLDANSGRARFSQARPAPQDREVVIASGRRAEDSGAAVLIAIDDEAGERQERAVLESAGNRVLTAAHAAAALRILSAQPCDPGLFAALPPAMEGFEVCRAIKQAPATRHIPVLLLLGSDDEVERGRAFQAAADDVVIKPVEQTLLLTLVSNQLRLAPPADTAHDSEGLVSTPARAVE